MGDPSKVTTPDGSPACRAPGPVAAEGCGGAAADAGGVLECTVEGLEIGTPYLARVAELCTEEFQVNGGPCHVLHLY